MCTKPLRVFRNHYICEECEHEFADEMLVISSSFCPCCDQELEPYSSESLIEKVEADEDEEETV